MFHFWRIKAFHMKRNILVFGLISGVILAAFIFFSFNVIGGKGHDVDSALVGYAAMIIAFSFIFVATRNFRDKYNGGIVSFGKAFRIGLGIALIGSTFYVLAWVIDYYFFIPDFMDKYTAHMIQNARASGLSAVELDKKISEIDSMSRMYKSPLFVVLFTYLEVLPVGIVISLITALALRRRTPKAGALEARTA
jgi:uncharacterized protein DUF4199